MFLCSKYAIESHKTQFFRSCPRHGARFHGSRFTLLRTYFWSNFVPISSLLGLYSCARTRKRLSNFAQLFWTKPSTTALTQLTSTYNLLIYTQNFDRRANATQHNKVPGWPLILSTKPSRTTPKHFQSSDYVVKISLHQQQFISSVNSTKRLHSVRQQYLAFSACDSRSNLFFLHRGHERSLAHWYLFG